MKYGRELLRGVEGYTPGEQPKTGDVVKLNTNENPYPPSPAVLKALHGLSADALRKYPDPVATELRTACAGQYGYPSADWVIAGNGMDELLAMTIRTFTDPGDRILTPYPTYILYETLASLHGAGTVFVDLTPDFQLSDDFFRTSARICFLPRPNSPSGVCPPRETVERLCGEFPGLVVIDEAYVDFGDDDCMDFPRRYGNAIVMRTFSKSFSLAGMRLGVAVAQPEIIAEFLKTKDSYNLNAATQAAGLAAMQDYAHMETNAARIRATRRRLSTALQDLGFSVAPSQANFVFAEWDGEPAAQTLFEELKRRNIFVRYFPGRRLDKGLRITVGTGKETDVLLDALKSIIT